MRPGMTWYSGFASPAGMLRHLDCSCSATRGKLDIILPAKTDERESSNMSINASTIELSRVDMSRLRPGSRLKASG